MNLTIEQMRKIVEGAPEGTTLLFCFGQQFENKVDYYKYFFNYFQMWLPDHGWFPVHPELAEDAIPLEFLRAALADHDRTDHCSDIKNHISPTTVVIER